jgi:hypothetical protein
MSPLPQMWSSLGDLCTHPFLQSHGPRQGIDAFYQPPWSTDWLRLTLILISLIAWCHMLEEEGASQ